MPRRRDPNLKLGHLCRFCGELVPWGEILRLLRVDVDQPPFMQSATACHTFCLVAVLRPGLELTFHRHWKGRAPLLDDDDDVAGQDCAICARPIEPAVLVRLRVQRPAGTVKAPEFDEQTLALHFDCIAAVSISKLS
jgi:hypothetical protein